MSSSHGGVMKFIGQSLLLFIVALSAISCGIQSIPQAQNEVEAKWAEVQNQYQRRADLIPNLVEVVKGYAGHEKETLQSVVEARAKATAINLDPTKLNADTMKQYAEAQGGLSSALGRLMVVVEKYPNLKADQNFRDLQVQLEGTENRVTVARNRFIDSIKFFNNLVSVPPTSWTNSIFYHFEKKPQFQVDNIQEVQQAPKVKF